MPGNYDELAASALLHLRNTVPPVTESVTPAAAAQPPGDFGELMVTTPSRPNAPAAVPSANSKAATVTKMVPCASTALTAGGNGQSTEGQSTDAFSGAESNVATLRETVDTIEACADSMPGGWTPKNMELAKEFVFKKENQISQERREQLLQTWVAAAELEQWEAFHENALDLEAQKSEQMKTEKCMAWQCKQNCLLCALYAVVLLFSFVEHHLSGFQKYPCKYLRACSPFQGVHPAHTDWTSSAITFFWKSPVPSFGSFWDALGVFGLSSVALLIYNMLPNVGKKAAEVLSMAYFVSNCYHWAGADTFGVLVRSFILTFTATTVVAFAWIWQQLDSSLEDCETAAEMKQTRKRFKKDCHRLSGIQGLFLVVSLEVLFYWKNNKQDSGLWF